MKLKYSSGIFKGNTIPVSSLAKRASTANEATGRHSLGAFLKHINDFGVQVQNNFEVTFDGLDGLTLFVQSIDLPGSKQNTCEIFYDGIKMTIPVNYECDHEFSMTIINDAQGFIYSAIKTFIEYDTYNHYSSSQNRMIIKALTGQIKNRKIHDSFYSYQERPLRDNSPAGDIAYQGAVIVAYGVRLTSISGLSYGQSSNDIQTFTVQGTLIEYSHLPLCLSDDSVSHNM